MHYVPLLLHFSHSVLRVLFVFETLLNWCLVYTLFLPDALLYTHTQAHKEHTGNSQRWIVETRENSSNPILTIRGGHSTS